MILGGLINLLASRTSITSIVPVARIYPEYLPQGADMPAIVVRQLDSNIQSQSLDGEKHTFNSLLTIDCYSATSHIQSDAIAIQMYAKPILSYRGTRQGVNIHGVLGDGSMEHSLDGVDPASDKRRFVTSVDLEIVWSVA
jgi:hypothetical protein